jgi:hypothetical protein
MELMINVRSKIFKSLSLIDETFDVKALPNYHLFIQLAINGLSCCVFDIVRKKFIAFENYTFQGIHENEILSESIQQLVKEDNLLSKCVRAKHTLLIWVNNKSTFIPNALYDPANKETYLKFNHDFNKNETILVDSLKLLEAKNLYTLPLNIEKSLKGIFLNVTIHHYSSSLVESLLSRYGHEYGKRIFVHVQVDHLEVVVIEGKNLLFYNSFRYQTSEDFVYYVLFVADQLKMSPENMELVWMGEAEKDSAIYLLLYKYVRNIKFCGRKEGVEYSYKFDNMPPHFYYNLFNQDILANN